MKRTAVALLMGLFAFCAMITAAPAQEKAAELKIAYVDVYKAMNESEQGKRAKSEIEAMAKSKQASLESKGRAIERLRSELEKQGDVLSAEAKKNKAEEYERLAREYQRNADDARNEVRKKENELTTRILKTIGDIVIAIGQEGKYSLIIEKQQLLFADSTLEITQEVINRLDSGSAATKTRKKK